MGKGQPLVLTGLLVMVSLFAPASMGHTQQTLTVILTDEGVIAGNITDPAFVQGNIAWFRMEDSTNNTSMVVRVDVDMDGDVDGDDLNTLGADAVFGVLANHFVLGSMVLSSELTDGQAIGMASGTDQTFDAMALTVGGASLNAGGLDVCAGNGAIHILDGVIGF